MNKRIVHGLLAAAFFALAGTAAAQAPKPHEIEDFIREDKFREFQVSPNGTYIALTVPVEDKTVLVVIKPGDPKPLMRMEPRGKKSHVLDVTWVSDERLVYFVGVRDALDEGMAYITESYAINADGKRAVQLSGFSGSPRTTISSRTGPAIEAFFYRIVDDLPNDDDNMIVAVFRPDTDYTTAERMNVNSASRLKLAQAPIKRARFVTDNAGQIRFAGGIDTDQLQKLFYRESADSEWVLLNDERKTRKKMNPIGFAPDDKVAYLISEETTGPDSVVAYDTSSGAFRTVIRDSLASPFRIINPIGKRYPIGAIFTGEKPRYEYFDPESADAKAHRALQRAFPGLIVLPGTEVTAKNEVPIYVFGDREPGGYYAMNIATRSVSPIMFSADWLPSDNLSSMRSVVFDARDGRRIPGWLTLPNGSGGKNLPMVIYPHGGPFGVDDPWGYDPVVQMLASHGYAVLQVNFRGSSGYGRDHEMAGYKQWGLTMQDDLTDATRWAIAQGVADKDRICIYGASYGAYAALMGSIKEQGLYRCAVGQVGVYDLPKVVADDAKDNDYLRTFFDMTFNDGDLAAVSPNRLASRVKVPVFLSAGREDEIAPVEHTEMMQAALEKAGATVETLYFNDEGHGIYKHENKAKFYTQLLTFLNRHIGGRAPVAPTIDTAKK